MRELAMEVQKMSDYEKGIEAAANVFSWIEPAPDREMASQIVLAFLAEQPEERRCEEHDSKFTNGTVCEYWLAYVGTSHGTCRMVRARIVVTP